MPLAGLLFDKDGTLVDLDRTWGEAAGPVLRKIGGGDDAAFGRLAEAMGYDAGSRRFRPGSPFVGGSFAELLLSWGEALGRPGDAALLREMNEAFAAETLRSLMPIGDPVAVLDALGRQGLALGLATNDSEASARAQLAALGLDGHVSFVAGYDSGHGGKPEPGMVLAFAASLGVSPGRVALVGDTLHDMEAARAAGAVRIAVLSGPATRAVLAPHADHVVGSVADLPALLPTLG